MNILRYFLIPILIVLLGWGTGMADWKSARAKKLGVEKDPGSWFYFEDPRGMGKPGPKSDWYSLSLALEAADVAEKFGLRFEDVLSTFITERHDLNPGGIYLDVHDKTIAKEYPAMRKDWWRGGIHTKPTNEKDAYSSILRDYSGRLLSNVLAQSMEYGGTEDPIVAFQKYSGEGEKPYGGRLNPNVRLFGVPVGKINFRDPKNPAYMAQGWEKYFVSTFLKELMKPGGPLYGIAAEQRSYNQPKPPTDLQKYLEISGINTELWPLLSQLIEE